MTAAGWATRAVSGVATARDGSNRGLLDRRGFIPRALGTRTLGIARVHFALFAVFIISCSICNTAGYNLVQKIFIYLGSPWSQQLFTVPRTSPSVVFSRSFSKALRAEVNTWAMAIWIQLPTGQARFGFFLGITNGSSSSTARKISANVIRPGERLNREPK